MSAPTMKTRRAPHMPRGEGQPPGEKTRGQPTVLTSELKERLEAQDMAREHFYEPRVSYDRMPPPMKQYVVVGACTT